MFKRISPIRLVSVIFAVIAVGFIITAGVFYGVKTKEIDRYERICTQGTIANASDIKCVSANVRINGSYMFYLTFKYLDADGQWQDGRTSAYYTEVEALNKVLNGLQIKYTDEGTVEADFSSERAEEQSRVLVTVFASIAGVFAVVAVVTFLSSKKSIASIEKNGVNAEGKILSKKGGLHLGKKETYSLEISFRNERGERVVGTTPHYLSADQAEKYALGDIVKIRYYGKDVILR